MSYHSYYFRSEKEAASRALRILETTLPSSAMSAVESPEHGTTIFRWSDSEGGGYKYSFQKPYSAIAKDGLWKPLGKIPQFAEACAYAHTHPNDTYFSNIDLETADGTRGLVKERTVMYMVNRSGGYWYDGRTDFVDKKSRHGRLW